MKKNRWNIKINDDLDSIKKEKWNRGIPEKIRKRKNVGILILTIIIKNDKIKLREKHVSGKKSEWRNLNGNKKKLLFK